MNALFQGKGSLIAILQDKSIRMTRMICKNFIKPELLDDLSNIEPINASHLLPLDQISLGRECETILSSLQDNESNAHFTMRCLSFYQTAYAELIKRLPLFDPLLKEMKFISPKTALNIDTRKVLPNLDNLVMKYGHLIDSHIDIQHEWDDLPAYFSADERNHLLQKKSCEEFWLYLYNLQNFSDEYVFRNLASLAKLILILPHFNGETERMFSLMTDAKTKKEK